MQEKSIQVKELSNHSKTRVSEVSQEASMTGIEWVKDRRVETRSEKGGESQAKQGLLGRLWRDIILTLSSTENHYNQMWLHF